MSKVLITYATREGQTEKVAGRIQEHLIEAGAQVVLTDAREALKRNDLDLNAFDLLVFGASMHAGGIEREMLAFIRLHATAIERKNRSFFLVLLSAATEDPELRSRWLADARDKVRDQLAVDFGDCEMVAGALAYSRYAMPLRWLMKRIARQAGQATDTARDYEYTDWAQVERYARSLLSSVTGFDGG